MAVIYSVVVKYLILITTSLRFTQGNLPSIKHDLKQQPLLKLSSFELHVLSDFMIEISILHCPSLKSRAALSMKAYFRDRVEHSPYKTLLGPEFMLTKTEFTKCYIGLSKENDTAAGVPSQKVETTTERVRLIPPRRPAYSHNEESESDPVPISAARTRTSRAPHRNPTRSMRSAPAPPVPRNKTETVFSKKNQFNDVIQAQQNFEEMLRSLISIVSYACQMAIFDEFLTMVSEDIIYWVSKDNSNVIFLSDYYFSESNLLPLARKCGSK